MLHTLRLDSHPLAAGQIPVRTSSSASRKSLRRVSVALDRYSSSSPLPSGDRSTAPPPSTGSVDAMPAGSRAVAGLAGGSGPVAVSGSSGGCQRAGTADTQLSAVRMAVRRGISARSLVLLIDVIGVREGRGRAAPPMPAEP